MVDLRRRLTIVERVLRTSHRGIFRVVLIHDPDGLSEDDAQAGEFKYRRLPDETVEAFRSRASADAEAHGIATIFFGHGARSEDTLAGAPTTNSADPDDLEQEWDGQEQEWDPNEVQQWDPDTPAIEWNEKGELT